MNSRGLEALNGIKSYIDPRIVKYPLSDYGKSFALTKEELL